MKLKIQTWRENLEPALCLTESLLKSKFSVNKVNVFLNMKFPKTQKMLLTNKSKSKFKLIETENASHSWTILDSKNMSRLDSLCGSGLYWNVFTMASISFNGKKIVYNLITKAGRNVDCKQFKSCGFKICTFWHKFIAKMQVVFITKTSTNLIKLLETCFFLIQSPFLEFLETSN